MSMLYLKGSFEDEGLGVFETQILSNLAKELDLPLAFKIGGCEAKSDIKTAFNYGAKCIVAPMVESDFAAKKFISATKPYLNQISERNINIETIDSVNKIEEIIKNNFKFLNGLVIGRTDLSLSMGLDKSMVDSDIVMEKVEESLIVAKKYNLTTTIGGSVNTKSIEQVKKLFDKGLLDRFETRKVIMSACSDDTVLLELLDSAFKIEKNFLSKTLANYNLDSFAASDRLNRILKRGLK